MDDTLTPERIQEMFRDFGLEHEEERQRLRALSMNSSDSDEESHKTLFTWAESTSGSMGEGDAKLAQHS